MKKYFLFAIAATLILNTNGWSWDNSQESAKEHTVDNSSHQLKEDPTTTAVIETQKAEASNITSDISPRHGSFDVSEHDGVDEVVDSIITYGREGRELKEYDEIYSDPNIQDILQNGDDNDARNLIKEKLCSLKLMQCGNTYIGPEDLVYAQPVDIQPVGRPIPSIPIKNPGRAIYGSPRPIPLPNKHRPLHHKTSPLLGVPPKRYGPVGAKPFYGSQIGPKPFVQMPTFNGPEILRPGIVETDTPYQFENPPSISNYLANKEFKKKIIEGQSDKVQQHVHHHFHHNSDADGTNKVAAQLNKPANLDLFKPSEQVYSSGGLSTSSLGAYNQQTNGGLGIGGTYGGQSIANYGYSGSVKPVNEQTAPQQFESVGLYGNNPSSAYGNSLYSNSFGTSVGSYGNTNSFYKKDFKVQGGYQTNYLTSTGDKLVGIESARSENYDCICVPYDQCPSQDIIGRKDDLYYALDPRNLKTDINAEEERVITDGNGTMTTVRVAKEIGLSNITNEDDVKKTVKRDVKEDSDDEKGTSKAEPRQNNYNNHNHKNFKPTFGVSFGLPAQGGPVGGYPLNPLNPHQQFNPYNNYGGINLGLVSVNPLVSIQVTKDEYGEKEIKPYVNLHVTPNDFLVHKFADIFNYKKQALFNKHHHFHQHNYRPFYPHKPAHYGPPIHGPGPIFDGPYIEHPSNFNPYSPYHHHLEPHLEKPNFEQIPIGLGDFGDLFFGRSFPDNNTNLNNLIGQYMQKYLQNQNSYGNKYENYVSFPEDSIAYDSYGNPTKPYDVSRRGKALGSSNHIKFPTNRRKRDAKSIQDQINFLDKALVQKRQAFYGNAIPQRQSTCGPRHVCCKRPLRPHVPHLGLPTQQARGQCGLRHSQGINGRIKNPVYVDGDSEFGEYPWQVAILKKDPKESVYVCGGTLIDPFHLITAAHCIKTYSPHELRVRLGEWDVNHDVEFYPYVERDVVSVTIHPEFYAGTLFNDIAIVRMDLPIDFTKYPHIGPACLPLPHDDYTGTRCWTTGWGKDAFGDFGKYQNILKEVDVPIMAQGECQARLQQTRLGYDFKLHQGFVCAGGEEGKDACKGDGGGPMVCERGGTMQVVGIVSWGVGCGLSGVPGVYVRVAHYLDWIRQVTQRF